MQFWLDTANINDIKIASQSGILFGVTTNPSIFSKAQTDADELIQQFLTIQPGLVAIQVTRTQSVNDMVHQARLLSALSPKRIVIKVPSTLTGFAAMRELKKHQILVLATAISSVSQFVAAANAGVDYAALYLSHMQKAGKDIVSEMEIMTKIARKNQWSVNLMGAAFADEATVQSSIAAGVNSVTVPSAIFNQLFAIESHVAHQLKQFETDWKSYQDHHAAGLLADQIAQCENPIESLA